MFFFIIIFFIENVNKINFKTYYSMLVQTVCFISKVIQNSILKFEYKIALNTCVPGTYIYQCRRDCKLSLLSLVSQLSRWRACSSCELSGKLYLNLFAFFGLITARMIFCSLQNFEKQMRVMTLFVSYLQPVGVKIIDRRRDL